MKRLILKAISYSLIVTFSINNMLQYAYSYQDTLRPPSTALTDGPGARSSAAGRNSQAQPTEENSSPETRTRELTSRLRDAFSDSIMLDDTSKVRARLIPIFQEIIRTGASRKLGIACASDENFADLAFIEYVYSLGFRPRMPQNGIASVISPKNLKDGILQERQEGSGCFIVTLGKEIGAPWQGVAKKRFAFWFKDSSGRILMFNEVENILGRTDEDLAEVSRRIKLKRIRSQEGVRKFTTILVAEKIRQELDSGREILVAGLDLVIEEGSFDTFRRRVEEETRILAREQRRSWWSDAVSKLVRMVSFRRQGPEARAEYEKCMRNFLDGAVALLRRKVKEKTGEAYLRLIDTGMALAAGDRLCPHYQTFFVARDLGMVPTTPVPEVGRFLREVGIETVEAREGYAEHTPPALAIRPNKPFMEKGAPVKKAELFVFVLSRKGVNNVVRVQDRVYQYADYGAYCRVTTPRRRLSEEDWEQWRRNQIIELAERGLLLVSTIYEFSSFERAAAFIDSLDPAKVDSEEKATFRYAARSQFDPNRFALTNILWRLMLGSREVSSVRIFRNKQDLPIFFPDKLGTYNTLDQFGCVPIVAPPDWGYIFQKDRMEVIDAVPGEHGYPAALCIEFKPEYQPRMEGTNRKDVYIFFRDPKTGRLREDLPEWHNKRSRMIEALSVGEAVTDLNYTPLDWQRYREMVLSDVTPSQRMVFEKLEFVNTFPEPRCSMRLLFPQLSHASREMTVRRQDLDSLITWLNGVGDFGIDDENGIIRNTRAEYSFNLYDADGSPLQVDVFTAHGHSMFSTWALSGLVPGRVYLVAARPDPEKKEFSCLLLRRLPEERLSSDLYQRRVAAASDLSTEALELFDPLYKKYAPAKPAAEKTTEPAAEKAAEAPAEADKNSPKLQPATILKEYLDVFDEKIVPGLIAPHLQKRLRSEIEDNGRRLLSHFVESGEVRFLRFFHSFVITVVDQAFVQDRFFHTSGYLEPVTDLNLRHEDGVPVDLERIYGDEEVRSRQEREQTAIERMQELLGDAMVNMPYIRMAQVKRLGRITPFFIGEIGLIEHFVPLRFLVEIRDGEFVVSVNDFNTFIDRWERSRDEWFEGFRGALRYGYLAEQNSFNAWASAASLNLLNGGLKRYPFAADMRVRIYEDTGSAVGVACDVARLRPVMARVSENQAHLQPQINGINKEVGGFTGSDIDIARIGDNETLVRIYGAGILFTIMNSLREYRSRLLDDIASVRSILELGDEERLTRFQAILGESRNYFAAGLQLSSGDRRKLDRQLAQIGKATETELRDDSTGIQVRRNMQRILEARERALNSSLEAAGRVLKRSDNWLPEGLGEVAMQRAIIQSQPATAQEMIGIARENEKLRIVLAFKGLSVARPSLVDSVLDAAHRDNWTEARLTDCLNASAEAAEAIDRLRQSFMPKEAKDRPDLEGLLLKMPGTRVVDLIDGVKDGGPAFASFLLQIGGAMRSMAKDTGEVLGERRERLGPAYELLKAELGQWQEERSRDAEEAARSTLQSIRDAQKELSNLPITGETNKKADEVLTALDLAVTRGSLTAPAVIPEVVNGICMREINRVTEARREAARLLDEIANADDPAKLIGLDGRKQQIAEEMQFGDILGDTETGKASSAGNSAFIGQTNTAIYEKFEELLRRSLAAADTSGGCDVIRRETETHLAKMGECTQKSVFNQSADELIGTRSAEIADNEARSLTLDARLSELKQSRKAITPDSKSDDLSALIEQARALRLDIDGLGIDRIKSSLSTGCDELIVAFEGTNSLISITAILDRMESASTSRTMDIEDMRTVNAEAADLGEAIEVLGEAVDRSIKRKLKRRRIALEDGLEEAIQDLQRENTSRHKTIDDSLGEIEEILAGIDTEASELIEALRKLLDADKRLIEAKSNVSDTSSSLYVRSSGLRDELSQRQAAAQSTLDAKRPALEARLDREKAGLSKGLTEIRSRVSAIVTIVGDALENIEGVIGNIKGMEDIESIEANLKTISEVLEVVPGETQQQILPTHEELSRRVAEQRQYWERMLKIVDEVKALIKRLVAEASQAAAEFRREDFSSYLESLRGYRQRVQDVDQPALRDICQQRLDNAVSIIIGHRLDIADHDLTPEQNEITKLRGARPEDSLRDEINAIVEESLRESLIERFDNICQQYDDRIRAAEDEEKNRGVNTEIDTGLSQLRSLSITGPRGPLTTAFASDSIKTAEEVMEGLLIVIRMQRALSRHTAPESRRPEVEEAISLKTRELGDAITQVNDAASTIRKLLKEGAELSRLNSDAIELREFIAAQDRIVTFDTDLRNTRLPDDLYRTISSTDKGRTMAKNRRHLVDVVVPLMERLREVRAGLGPRPAIAREGRGDEGSKGASGRKRTRGERVEGALGALAGINTGKPITAPEPYEEDRSRHVAHGPRQAVRAPMGLDAMLREISHDPGNEGLYYELEPKIRRAIGKGNFRNAGTMLKAAQKLGLDEDVTFWSQAADKWKEQVAAREKGGKGGKSSSAGSLHGIIREAPIGSMIQFIDQQNGIISRDLLARLILEANLTDRERDIVIATVGHEELLEDARKHHERIILTRYHQGVLKDPDDPYISSTKVAEIRDRALAKLKRALERLKQQEHGLLDDIRPRRSSSAGAVKQREGSALMNIFVGLSFISLAAIGFAVPYFFGDSSAARVLGKPSVLSGILLTILSIVVWGKALTIRGIRKEAAGQKKQDRGTIDGLKRELTDRESKLAAAIISFINSCNPAAVELFLGREPELQQKIFNSKILNERAKRWLEQKITETGKEKLGVEVKEVRIEHRLLKKDGEVASMEEEFSDDLQLQVMINRGKGQSPYMLEFFPGAGGIRFQVCVDGELEQGPRGIDYGKPYYIGRDPRSGIAEADGKERHISDWQLIILENLSGISRLHCTVEITKEETEDPWAPQRWVRIKDNSANGTYVEYLLALRHKIKKPAAKRPALRVEAGSTSKASSAGVVLLVSAVAITAVVLILIAKKLLGKKEPAVDKDNVIELGHGLSYTMGEALEFLKSDRPADFDFGYSIFQNASEEQKYRLLDSLPRSKIQEIAAMDKGKTIVVTTIEEVQERPIKGIAITDRLKGTLVISIPDPASPYKFKVSVRGKETRTVSLEVPEKLVASDSGSYELEDGTAYSIRRLREGMEQNGFYSDAEDLIIIPINASDILGDEEFFTLKITCSGDDVWLELRDDNSYYGISVTYSRVVHRLEPRVDPSSKTVVTPGAARAAGAPISLGASMQELSKAMKQSASTTQTRPPGRGTKGRGKPQKSSSSGMRPAPISSINELDIENATLYRESDYVRLYKARDKVRGDEYIIKVYCGETSPKFQHATREIVSHLLWLSEQYSQLTDMPRCFEKGEIYLKGGRISQMAEGDGPYPYVIMDFVPGTDFLNIIAQLGFEKTDDQIGPRDVWSTKIKLLYSIGIDVLRYHRAGLLIKDLKPNNIILSPDATVRVADLKAAIPLRHDWQDDSAHQISKAIRIIHTELFAEDISIFDASTPNELDRSFLLFTEQWDIYSFGITAFALLAPEQYNSYTDPTRVTTAAEIKQNIRDYLDKYIAATDHLHDDDILRQSTIEAYRVIRRCIEQDREVRYQDMAAVLAAIRISIEILDATPTASHRAMPDTRHVVAAIASAA